MSLPAAYTVAVRTLCEFTARAGDLDLRFTPSPSAQQGIAGHQLVAARRAASYETEISLQGGFGPLTVRGRADGFDPDLQRLEEIKTFRGKLDRQPANQRALHWAQLKVYGALMCEARGMESLRLALVYLDLGTQEETVIEETHTAAALRTHFEALCDRYAQWAQQEASHRLARDQALAALAFPHGQFRSGQRELSEAVWRAASRGRCLMAQAPTGIGKTVGTLFPMLKATPAQGLDKVYFLAAKTPGRRLGLDALGLLRDAGAHPLRVLELSAREKTCEHPDKACHGESCPLARGFYDRLPQARAAALAAPVQDLAAVREAALAHEVCPYWLGQELARWCDVVVGDYNYFFDGSALLHALALEQEWRCGVLVDEAHNLVERGRQMYSAELDERTLAALRKSAPKVLRRPLDRLARQWRELVRKQEAPYVAHEDLPGKFVHALTLAIADIADHLAEAPEAPAGELQQFYFEALAFSRLVEKFGDHSIFDVSVVGARPSPQPSPQRGEGESAPSPSGRGPGVRVAARTVLCIRNLLPAPHLAPRFAAARSVVLFSATMDPPGFYMDMLGLPGDTVAVDVASPFSAEQLSVRTAPRISTRWADRERSVAPIADLIARQWQERSGNYLAFFSSFDYLHRVAARLAEAHPHVPLWEQSARMSEADRQAFIDRFTPGGTGVGFAVLGGAFGEGIDLPGNRLVGAFVATLGLPQVNPVNERLRARLQQAFGQGFDYTYLYPGLRKVVQAAGRVIRTREDQGVVWLIDDRFGRPEVRTLLPRWWAL